MRRSALRLPARVLLPALGCLALFTLFRQVRLSGWDEAFYLAQLLSFAGDRDLALQDDLVAIPNELPLRLRTVTLVDGAGAPRNLFSIGPAWLHSCHALPFAATPARRAALRATLSLASMLLLVLSLLLTRNLLLQFGVAPALAAACSAGSVLWGPLAVYGTRAYLNAHLPSAFWAALLLVAYRRWEGAGRTRHALLAGVAAGALAITRWQDLVLVGAVAATGAVTACQDPGQRRRRVATLLAGAAAAALVGLVQLLAFERQFGAWLLLPQGAGFMHWREPALGGLLFSGVHGLFTWTPLFGIGLLGLTLVPAQTPARPKVLVGALALAAVLTVYVSAAADDWWAGSAFGPRRLSALSPVAALGLAFVARRCSRAIGALAAIAATAWALFVMSAYFSGYEDLATVLWGRPSVAAGLLGPVRAWTGWQDPWGPLHAAKPGFTLQDAPGNPDRLLGLAIVTGVCALAAVVWRLGRTRVGQALFVLAALGWAAVWLTVLARMPSNATVNAAWRTRLEGRSAGANPAPLPAPDQLLLEGICALWRGDTAGGAAALARAERAGAAPVSAADVVQLLENPEQIRFALGEHAASVVCGAAGP